VIGVDSKVLLRLFVDDDAEQHQRSKAFFASRSDVDPAYVNVIVLAELVWLMSKRYRLPRPDIVTALNALLESENVELESRPLVERVVERFRSDADAGLADLLIAALNEQASCRSTVTFDISAARDIPGMELLK
jgi:predicted nucleic-acid-binding protein